MSALPVLRIGYVDLREWKPQPADWIASSLNDVPYNHIVITGLATTNIANVEATPGFFGAESYALPLSTKGSITGLADTLPSLHPTTFGPSSVAPLAAMTGAVF